MNSSRMNRFLFFCLTLSALLTTSSCKQEYTPKPRGYFRIDFPEKEYVKLDTSFPYTFEYSKYSVLEQDLERGAEKYWINIHYPQYKGTIHISYKTVTNNLNEYLEDARKMAYKHTIKADAINEKTFIDADKKVFGMLYQIKGNAASSVQFVATDSTKHFLRGALYFFEHPNQDSLAPVIQYVESDIQHMMETLNWKK